MGTEVFKMQTFLQLYIHPMVYICAHRSGVLLCPQPMEAGAQGKDGGESGQGDQDDRREGSGGAPLIIGANPDPGGRRAHQEELSHRQQEGRGRR